MNWFCNVSTYHIRPSISGALGPPQAVMIQQPQEDTVRDMVTRCIPSRHLSLHNTNNYLTLHI